MKYKLIITVEAPSYDEAEDMIMGCEDFLTDQDVQVVNSRVEDVPKVQD